MRLLQLKNNPMKSDLNTMQYLSKQGKPLAKGVLSNMLTTAKNHLVQVQKTVTRAGKTFLQNFWIDPDDPEQMRKTADMLGSIAQPNSPFHRWNQTLSDKEYGFIKDYTSDAFYRELNALLRGTTPKKRGYTSDFTLEALKERATVIGAALDRFDLPQEIVTYRIMDDGFKDKLQVGDIIHDKGYTSTSVGKWSETQPNYTYLKIRVPAGKGRGAWIAPISWVKEEQEFLLNRGTKFRITKVKRNKDGSQFAECEVIDREPGDINDMKKSVKSNRIKHKRLDRFTWSVDEIEIVRGR